MDILQNNNILDLQVSEETKSELNGLSQWMKINAIIALITLAVSLIATVSTAVKASRYGVNSGSSLMGTMVTASISVLMNLTLIAAAKNIKAGIGSADQELFIVGMTKLKTFFLIYGIIMIIVMVLVLLATLVFTIAAGRNGF